MTVVMPPKVIMSTHGLATKSASWHNGHVPLDPWVGGGDWFTVIVVVWLLVIGGEPLSVAVKVTV